MLDILHLDNHLLAVNKPAGLLAQADETGDPDVLSLAKAYLKETFNKPGNVFVGLVHRLDRPASGVMVLACTSKAAGRLSEQFRLRTAGKRYLALVEGTREGSGTLTGFLLKEERRVRVVPASHPGALSAELRWEAIAQRNGLSLVEIKLETGRPHQIRVQLAHAGTPILGDFRYGARRPLDGRNLALHCYGLSVDHPTREERLTWSAPPPSSWGGTFHGEIVRLLAMTPEEHGSPP